MKSKVARELLNDFESTSFHIKIFSLSKIYIFRVSLDIHLISNTYLVYHDNNMEIDQFQKI